MSLWWLAKSFGGPPINHPRMGWYEIPDSRRVYMKDGRLVRPEMAMRRVEDHGNDNAKWLE